MSIRFKLYMALSAAVLLVTLTLLFFLQFSVGSFESYVNELDARMMQRVAERLEQRYAENGESGWEFIEGDLQSWLAREGVFARGEPMPGGWDSERIAPRNPALATEGTDVPRFPAPPEFQGTAFRPPQSFQARLVLRGPDDAYVAGSVAEQEVSQHAELHRQGQTIGRLQLLALDQDHGFPAMLAAPFPAGSAQADSSSYVSDLVSRARFMTVQNRIFMTLVFASISVLLLLGLPLARHFTRRIDAINLAASRLSQGDFSTRIATSGGDELSQLAGRFNYLAEVLQRNKSSQQMWVSNISHELRTPLCILKGELEAVQDGVRQADDEHINMLCQEVEQLNRLVNDLFELSMSDLGGLAYEKENLSVLQIIDDSVARFRDQSRSHGLSLQVDAESVPLLTVFGDRQRLMQLFSNLIQNSLKYTYPGGTIRIALEARADSVVVRIEDSAPGVPVDQLDRLFERFYRGEKSRNRTTGGAGLGLAICRSIADSHQASIHSGLSSLGGILIELIFPRVKQI
ncbi:MAG: HAMP domain-containing protein [Pseudomonadales bacterium]|nr:HAMP domain-containing protein [Pseudomonadales bacterium]